MRKYNKLFQGDKVIWMIVAMLALVSLMAVYSATGTYANAKFDWPWDCVQCMVLIS